MDSIIEIDNSNVRTFLVGKSIYDLAITIQSNYSYELNTTSRLMDLHETGAWEYIFLKTLTSLGLPSLFNRNEIMLEERNIAVTQIMLPLVLEIYHVLLSLPDMPEKATIPARYGLSSRKVLKDIFSIKTIINVEFAKIQLLEHLSDYLRVTGKDNTVLALVKGMQASNVYNILAIHPQLIILILCEIASHLGADAISERLIEAMGRDNDASVGRDQYINAYINLCSDHTKCDLKESELIDTDGIGRSIDSYISPFNVAHLFNCIFHIS